MQLLNDISDAKLALLQSHRKEEETTTDYDLCTVNLPGEHAFKVLT